MATDRRAAGDADAQHAVDVAMVRAAAGGDRGALAAVYVRYRPLVRGVLLARLGPADADDVVQEVFMLAERKLTSLRDPQAVGAWLCTIARSKAIDWLRARKRERIDTGGGHNDDGDLVDNVSASSPEPSDVIEAKRVLRAIQELPEAYREPLVLRLVEGMTGAEIAAHTGLTEGSVRVNLYRGMALLKERVGAVNGSAR